MRPLQSDSPYRVKSLCDNVNNFLYKLAHEPSVAGHRIQEHVYKTVPILTKEQANVTKNIQSINGTMYDLDYSHEFLKKLDEPILISANTREIISELASKVSAAIANKRS